MTASIAMSMLQLLTSVRAEIQSARNIGPAQRKLVNRTIYAVCRKVSSLTPSTVGKNYTRESLLAHLDAYTNGVLAVVELSDGTRVSSIVVVPQEDAPAVSNGENGAEEKIVAELGEIFAEDGAVETRRGNPYAVKGNKSSTRAEWWVNALTTV